MYYAVRKGRTPGIYSTWDEAKIQVVGFSGAVYKKFKDINSAKEYLGGMDSEPENKPKKVVFYAVKNDNSIFTSWDECQAHIKGVSGAIFRKFKTEHDANMWLAEDVGICTNKDAMDITIPTFYVDGSCKDEVITFGMVAIIGDKEVCYNGRTDGDMGSCSGEISAFAFALHFASSMNLREINVVYDCRNIMEWATGLAKTHNDESRMFKRFVDTFLLRNKIKVNYYKCKSHTGDLYNEKADWLAKRAFMSNMMYSQVNLFNEGLVLNV